MIRTKDVKGITLIALVITIIVLLIIAGVSIALLIGENGVLTIPYSVPVSRYSNIAVFGVEEYAFDYCDNIIEINGGRHDLVIRSCAFKGSQLGAIT